MSQSASDYILRESSAFYVPANYLTSGKIIVQNDNSTETIQNVRVYMQRWGNKVTAPLDAEIQFFLTNDLGIEEALSNPIAITNADFTGLNQGAEEKLVDLIFQGSGAKAGGVRMKMREKFNGSWSPYRYV